MKKVRLLTMLMLAVFMLSGCKQKSVKINASNIDVDTMLIKADGTVQVATVESFDQSYYDKEELESFITDHITEYNTEAGNEEAITLDSLSVKDKNAIMILEYQSMQDFADFTETDVQYYEGITDDVLALLPDTLEQGKEGESVSKEELSDQTDLKVVIIDAQYDFLVNDEIKYYSNGEYVDENTIQTGSNGATIVIY